MNSDILARLIAIAVAAAAIGCTPAQLTQRPATDPVETTNAPDTQEQPQSDSQPLPNPEVVTPEVPENNEPRVRVRFDDDPVEEDDEEPTEGEVVVRFDPNPEGPQAPNRVFVQPHLSKKVNILFVADNSNEFAPKLASFANQLGNLFNYLDQHVSYSVAVLSGSSADQAGNLVHGDSAHVLRSRDIEPQRMQRLLKQKLTSLPKSNQSLALHSLNQATDTDSRHFQRMNEQGYFVEYGGRTHWVIFLSDDQKDCQISSVCQNLNASQVYQNLTQVTAGGPLFVSVFTPSLNQTVARSSQELSQSVLQMAEQNTQNTDPMLWTLDLGSFGEGSMNFGRRVVRHLRTGNLVRNFPFGDERLVADSIKVKVDGQVVEHSYNSETNTISIRQAGAAGSRVEFFYNSTTSE